MGSTSDRELDTPSCINNQENVTQTCLSANMTKSPSSQVSLVCVNTSNKLVASIILNGEKPKALPLPSGTRQILLSIVLEDLEQ